MTKEELMRLKELTHEIKEAQEKASEYRSMAERVTHTLTAMPGGGTYRSALEEAALDLMMVAQELEEKQSEHLRLQIRLAEEMKELKGAQSRVLIQRYLKGKSFRAIAADLKWSVSKVFKVHRAALDEIIKAK